MPRRSGTTTVWSFASSAAIGDHMWPVSPKPWISTTAGPWPPTRTLIVASAFATCKLRKSAGKGVGSVATSSHRPRQRHIDHVFGDEPDLQFVAADHVADKEVVRAVVAGLGCAPRHGASFLQDDFVSMEEARNLHGHFLTSFWRSRNQRHIHDVVGHRHAHATEQLDESYRDPRRAINVSQATAACS